VSSFRLSTPRGQPADPSLVEQAELSSLQKKLAKAKSDKTHYARKQAEEEEKLEKLGTELDELQELVETWTAEVVRLLPSFAPELTAEAAETDHPLAYTPSWRPQKQVHPQRVEVPAHHTRDSLQKAIDGQQKIIDRQVRAVGASMEDAQAGYDRAKKAYDSAKKEVTEMKSLLVVRACHFYPTSSAASLRPRLTGPSEHRRRYCRPFNCAAPSGTLSGATLPSAPRSPSSSTSKSAASSARLSLIMRRARLRSEFAPFRPIASFLGRALGADPSPPRLPTVSPFRSRRTTCKRRRRARATRTRSSCRAAKSRSRRLRFCSRSGTLSAVRSGVSTSLTSSWTPSFADRRST